MLRNRVPRLAGGGGGGGITGTASGTLPLAGGATGTVDVAGPASGVLGLTGAATGTVFTTGPWEVAGASYGGVSFNVIGQDTLPTGVALSADGTKMYVVGYNSQRIYQYSLSTAWNAGTASYSGTSFSVAAPQGSPLGLAFSADGTKMYVTNFQPAAVFQYSLSTAWDVGSASYSGISFSVAGRDTFPNAIAFSADGTKMYFSGNTNTIFQYSLSTAWNVGSASYSLSFNASGQETSVIRALAFKPDGSRMYVLGSASVRVNQYSLSTAWDVSSASFGGFLFSVAAQEIEPTGLAFKPDGSRMYVVGSGTDRVYQYDLYSGASSSGTASGTLDITGNAAGAVANSGAAAGALPLTGSATGVIGNAPATATASGTVPLGGAASGTVAVSGPAAGTLPLAGGAAGAVAVSAVGNGTLPLSGTATGAIGNVPITATASGALDLGGTATGKVNVSGPASGTLPLTGAATGAVANSGIASGTLPITGAATGTVGTTAVSGTAAGTLPLGGTATGTVTSSGPPTSVLDEEVVPGLTLRQAIIQLLATTSSAEKAAKLAAALSA